MSPFTVRLHHWDERSTMVATVVMAVMLLARVAAAQPAAPGDSSRCLTCHGMSNLASRESGSAPVHNFSVSPQTFSVSVHGQLACQQCHGEIGSYPHRLEDGRAKVTCAQACHAQDRDGRPYSHTTTVADFETSVHRSGASGDPTDRPTCLSCHGKGDPHAIERARGQSPRARMALCADCHDDRARMARTHVEPDAVSSYKRSFHYKAITFGERQAAVCQDCHTTHRILAPSDPRSSVAPAALPVTCGQTSCHPGARPHFAVSGANHLDLRVKREPILLAEEWLFRMLTAGTMAMLVVGIVLDVQKAFGWIALLKGIAGRARRRLDAVSAIGRRAVRFARWLLVE
jgi:hypothetical protein